MCCIVQGNPAAHLDMIAVHRLYSQVSKTEWRCPLNIQHTLICPRFATVQGKVQFLGGRFRSENLHMHNQHLEIL